MAKITVWNMGKRTWLKGTVRGLEKDLQPNDSAEMEEIDALRFINGYPEIKQSGPAIPSTAELERREQSIRDRETNLKEKEKRLDEREKALDERETNLKFRENPENFADGPTPEKDQPEETPARGKPGRKPRAGA